MTGATLLTAMDTAMTLSERYTALAVRRCVSRPMVVLSRLIAVTLLLGLFPGVGLANDPLQEPLAYAPAAQDRPDLKIEYAGFTGPDQLSVKFKVSNIGKARSSSGVSVKIVTLNPGPTREVNLPLSVLQPGASNNEVTNPLVYTLAGLCNNGLQIRASLDDQQDFNTANDRVDIVVCPPITPESPPDALRINPSRGVSIKPDLNPASTEVGLSVIPEHLQRGEHTLELEPSEVYRNSLLRTNEGIFGCLREKQPSDVSNSNVGFDYEDWTGCDFNHVQQLIVNFDLQWLRDMDRKLIIGAELQYDEHVVEAGGTEHLWTQMPDGRVTCIGRTGEAPRDWRRIVGIAGPGLNEPILVTSEDVDGDRNASGWNVTSEIQRSFLAGAELYGFVLHGLSEDLDAEMGFQTCRSRLENVRLNLRYAIL